MMILEAQPKEIQKSYGRSFWWTCKFLREDAADQACMLYAFYRHTKEIAAIKNKYRALELLGQLEEELDAPRCTFMVRFSEILEQLRIDKLYAREIISAARFQAGGSQVAHHGQLVIYCYKSMGAMGHMMARALGAKDPKVGAYAFDLGIGSNLARICAEVLDDANKGNVFLPLRELERSNICPKDLKRRGKTPVELKRIIERYADLAHVYLESSRAGLAGLPLASRIGVLLALRSSQELLRKIRRLDYEVLNGPIRLGAGNKARIGMGAFSDMLRPFFWRPFWLAGKRKSFLRNSILGLPSIAAEGATSE